MATNLQITPHALSISPTRRYADNVVKGFATSLSIVLSSVVSLFIPSFQFSLTPAFMAGSTLVIAATILYTTLPTPSTDDRRQPLPASYAHGLTELKLV